MSADGRDSEPDRVPYSPYVDPIRDETSINGRDVNEGVYPEQPDATGSEDPR